MRQVETLVGALAEAAQQVRIGGGEGLVDGLIGIPDAHPVAALAGQQAQNIFLQSAGILGLIFQDVRPAVAQLLQQRVGGDQQLIRQADEVIEVHRAAIGQGALVAGIDLQPHLGQGQGSRLTLQMKTQPFGGEAAVLGRADELGRDLLHQSGPIFAPHPANLGRAEGRREVEVEKIRVILQPCAAGFGNQGGRDALIHDGELFIEADQGRILAHDVMRQSVQGADAIAEMGDEPARLDELAHPGREVLYSRIDQRDDQHLLIGLESSAGDDLRGEGREGMRLARAGHGGDAQRAVGIAQDFRLGGARRKGHGSCCNTFWNARNNSPRCSNPLSPRLLRPR